MKRGWVKERCPKIGRSGVLSILVLASTAGATDLTPLSAETDESVFGPDLLASLDSPFSAVAFSGTLKSRVYADAVFPAPATAVATIGRARAGCLERCTRCV